MYRLFLAGRYTLARPVSYLAMVAISLAVMALIVVVSIMNGFLDETKAFLRGTTADIVVFPLQGDVPYRRAPMLSVLRSHPDVAAVSSRLVRPAVFKVHGRASILLGNSRDAVATQVLVHGIDVQEELENTRFEDYVAGVERPELWCSRPDDPFWIDLKEIHRDLRYGDHPRVLMSEVLLVGLGLGKGDGVDLVTVPDGYDLSGEAIKPTTQTFVVAGAFNTGHYNHDKSNVYIERELFGPWAGTRQEVSELYLTVRPGLDDGQLDRIKGELDVLLRARGFPSVVETWKDRHSIWLGAVENERNILFVIFFFFLLLVCTITFSVLTMMVQQKVRDIGVLSAMGAPASGIGAVFGLVGVCIASIGGLLGLGSGVALADNINGVKDLIEKALGIEIFSKEVYAFTEIPVALNHDLNVAIAAVTVVGAVVICLLPAIRAARMDPVEALRHE